MSLKLFSLNRPIFKGFSFILIGLFVFVIVIAYTSTSIASALKEYTLEELYTIALENSEKIRISEEELFISERVKDKAISVLLPKVSTFAGYTRYGEEKFSSSHAVIQPQSAVLWGARIDQSFSLSGREITALNISSKGIQKSKYDLFAAKESYLLSVSLAYYDLLRAKKLLDIARSNVERLTKHRDAALIRLKIGEVTKTALLRAEAELSGAISERIRSENNLKLARTMLARIVGLSGDFELKETSTSEQSFQLDFLKTECTLSAIECFKQAAFSKRSDLKSLEIQKKISEDQVKYVRGAYFPTISIEGVWSMKDEDPASASLIKENIYGTVKINFPFFEGGLRTAEIREAESRKRQAELLYEDAKRSIATEVENAYLDFITLKSVLKSLEDQLTFARDNFNSINKQFEFGLANSIDVMDANTLLITAERQLSDAIYSFQATKTRLKKATGVLYIDYSRD